MRRAPNPDLGLAILRVVIGVIFVTHGAPKLFGGIEATAQYFGEGLGLPLAGLLAWVVTLLEVFGGISLILGFLVTPVAVLFIVEMLVGILLVHAPEGWYVIGPGQNGAEFNTLLISGLLALIFAGPGTAAIDARRAAADTGMGYSEPASAPPSDRTTGAETPGSGSDRPPAV